MVQKTTLQRLIDDDGQGGIIRGRGAAPNGHNLSGAVQVLLDALDTAETHGLGLSDLPAETQEQLTEAHEDLQYLEGELGAVLDALAGNDGAIEDADGQPVLNLPRQASDRAQDVAVPAATSGPTSSTGSDP